jgi:hypothetical protein
MLEGLSYLKIYAVVILYGYEMWYLAVNEKNDFPGNIWA